MKLGLLAEALGLPLSGGADIEIENAAPLDKAGPRDISFAVNTRAAQAIEISKAGALVLPKGVQAQIPAIIADNPLHAFARVLEILHPERKPAPGVHSTAVIGDGVVLGEGVHIGPHVSIGNGATISNGAMVRAGARIGDNCSIGVDTVIFENSVVYDGCHIGSRCRIHSNAVIGADGFGYTRLQDGRHFKIPQIGSVVIEDDVEIGAGTCIDRAMMESTVIKRGAKLDNLVQIGHNTVIGEDVVMAGCSATGGSAVIGNGVMVGGACAISDHVKISSGVLIAGLTGVHTDLTEPGVYSGPLAMKNMEYKRWVLSGKKLDKVNDRVKAIEDKLGIKRGSST